MWMFGTGFDNYTNITDWWDGAGVDCSIRVNTGAQRTATSCLQINSGAFGPLKNFGHKTDLCMVTAWSSDRAGPVFRFLQTDNIGPNVSVNALADGSLQFTTANLGVVIGQTAAGLVLFNNSYVSIAVRVRNFTPSTGELTCWINGVMQFHGTGLNTCYDPAFPYCNAIQLMGPGGIPVCFHDDFYLLDCSSSPNADFLGALRLYPLGPTANGSTVQWSPLANTNWQEVADNPPDGDTSYNSDATVGAIDQYVYPLVGVPPAASIMAVQHELDMRVDSGSRSVTSDVNTEPFTTGVALTNGYHIYVFPYDVEPSGGLPWTQADFPVDAGPKVVA